MYTNDFIWEDFNYSYLIQTDSMFYFIFITYSWHTIISCLISLTLLTSNMLISIDPGVCNLKHFTFLIFFRLISSSFTLFTFGVINGLLNLFLLLPCFHLNIFLTVNYISLPPCFSMPSWTFYSPTSPTCGILQISLQNFPITIYNRISLTAPIELLEIKWKVTSNIDHEISQI